MNDLKQTVTRLLGRLSPRALVIIGLAGVLLLVLPGLWPREKKAAASPSVDPAVYAETLEDEIGRLVTSLTGDRSPTVVITLDTGVRAVYADDTKGKTTDRTDAAGAGQTVTETENAHVVLRGSGGGESAVTVTEVLPAVRGVAVVCRNGDTEAVRIRVTEAVTAALAISDRKICVSGKAQTD